MANSYLTRTPSSASNRKTWTFSAWVKRSAIPSAAGNYLFQQSQAEGNYMKLYFHANKIYWRGQTGESNTAYKVTNRLFRDTSAWYHIVARFDSTQNTAADRMRLYVNGVEETSFSTNINPDLNHDSFCNTTNPMDIGRDNVNNGSYFDGYMTHVSFVDGQSLAPTSFGETDSTSGIWKFKSPSGITWGTNGFHLKMENSGALGTDSSGNTNTFTVNGNLKQALDTPSNVYSINNIVDCARISSGANKIPTYSNGANTVNHADTNYYTGSKSSIGVMSGKWYVEAKVTSVGDQAFIGLAQQDDYSEIAETYLYEDDGTFGGSAYASSYGGTHGGSAGDIIQIAFDATNGTVWLGLNGTWQNSATQTEIENGTTANAAASGLSMTNFWHIASKGYNGATFNFNFGNGFFGTTAISNAGSNGNGSLFEYDVPSGYYALNTKNINTYG